MNENVEYEKISIDYETEYYKLKNENNKLFKEIHLLKKTILNYSLAIQMEEE